MKYIISIAIGYDSYHYADSDATILKHKEYHHLYDGWYGGLNNSFWVDKSIVCSAEEATIFYNIEEARKMKEEITNECSEFIKTLNHSDVWFQIDIYEYYPGQDDDLGNVIE